MPTRRAKATAIQMTPEMVNNPEAMKNFQAAQANMGSALSRLLVAHMSSAPLFERDSKPLGPLADFPEATIQSTPDGPY